jgi:hypothetical protein
MSVVKRDWISRFNPGGCMRRGVGVLARFASRPPRLASVLRGHAVALAVGGSPLTRLGSHTCRAYRH